MIEPTEDEIARAAAEVQRWGVWGPFSTRDNGAVMSDAIDDVFTRGGLRKSSDAIGGFLYGLNVGLRIVEARKKAAQ